MWRLGTWRVIGLAGLRQSRKLLRFFRAEHHSDVTEGWLWRAYRKIAGGQCAIHDVEVIVWWEPLVFPWGAYQCARLEPSS